MVNINSEAYIEKFSGVTFSPIGDKRVAEFARLAITANEGKFTEDVYFLNAKNGKVISHQKSGEYGGSVYLPLTNDKMIALHNHPNSASFSFEDIVTLNNCPEIKTMIAVGHNGCVYFLEVNNGNRLDLSDKSCVDGLKMSWQRDSMKYGKEKAIDLLIESLRWLYYVK